MTLFFSVHVCSQEEREVLCSIYESDECFKEQSSTSFAYRVRIIIKGKGRDFWTEGYLQARHFPALAYAPLAIYGKYT